MSMITIMLIGCVIFTGFLLFVFYTDSEQFENIKNLPCDELTQELENYTQGNRIINQWISKECWK